MPPNDDPFATDDPPATPETLPEPQPATAITLDQVNDSIASATAPLQSANTTLQTENAALREQMAQLTASFQTTAPQPAAVADPEASQDAYVARLASDAEATVIASARTVAQEEVRQTLSQISPLFEQMSENTHNTLLSNQRTEIDTRFGAGAWDKVFAEPMAETIRTAKAANPQQLSDPNWLGDQVAIQLGRNIDTLQTYKTETATTAAAAEQTRMTNQLETFAAQNTGMTGGMAFRPRTDANAPLTEAEKEYAAAQPGVPLDMKALRGMSGVKNVKDYNEYTTTQGAK